GKGDIKNLLNYMSRHDHVPDSSAFNWKDGFFDYEKMEAYKAADERKAREAMYASQKSPGARGSAPRRGTPNGAKPPASKNSGRKK
ncbi:MAG: hypothetical protein IJL80_02215, partial [Treponema sp.]|nr:hypothetical protein [Treponema sp.]